MFGEHNFAISMDMKSAFILDSTIVILEIYFIKILFKYAKAYIYIFIAALFVPVKNWDRAKFPLLQDQINKVVYIHILQKYSITLKYTDFQSY